MKKCGQFGTRPSTLTYPQAQTLGLLLASPLVICQRSPLPSFPLSFLPPPCPPPSPSPKRRRLRPTPVQSGTAVTTLATTTSSSRLVMFLPSSANFPTLPPYVSSSRTAGQSADARSTDQLCLQYHGPLLECRHHLQFAAAPRWSLLGHLVLDTRCNNVLHPRCVSSSPIPVS